MSVTWTLIGHYLIGEYSATKIHFFLWRRKNCEKVSPYFLLSGVEKFPNLHFFGKNFSRLALFWQKFAIFGGKLLILGGKSIKIGIFWVKSFPPLIFFPTPPPTFIWQNIHL